MRKLYNQALLQDQNPS